MNVAGMKRVTLTLTQQSRHDEAGQLSLCGLCSESKLLVNRDYFLLPAYVITKKSVDP